MNDANFVFSRLFTIITYTCLGAAIRNDLNDRSFFSAILIFIAVCAMLFNGYI